MLSIRSSQKSSSTALEYKFGTSGGGCHDTILHSCTTINSMGESSRRCANGDWSGVEQARERRSSRRLGGRRPLLAGRGSFVKGRATWARADGGWRPRRR